MVTVLCVALFACDNKPTDPTPGDTPGNDTPDTPTPGGDTPGNDTPGGDTHVTPTPGNEVDNTIAVPADLAVDTQGKATWGRVNNISGYQIEVNGQIYASRFTTFDLLGIDSVPTDGRFVLRVRAVKGDAYGDWSDTVEYEHRGVALVTPSVTELQDGKLVWKDNSDAQYPVLTIDGVAHRLPKGTTSYSLADVGQCSIALYFEGDVYHASSATLRLQYSPDDGLSFAAPAKVYMQGNILHFDRVEGANIYYFKDVYNTVTSLSGSDINDLQSDREGKFLVQSVWAGNTDLPIADSLPTAVTYFAVTQGDGSPAHPFEIGNAGEMRYIEYYEALGQPKYYRLTTDIDFAPNGVTIPADDEEYSNFYNLGSFSGVLDGGGHTISNIVVYYKDGYSSIFDNITDKGKISNLCIADTYWRTWTNRTNDGIMHEKGGECAILAYTNRGIIEDVTLVSGSVTAVKDGGAGLVAINRGTIRRCTMQSGFAVYGANEAGSMAIYNVGTIEDCVNYGVVAGKSSVGGIVGRNAGLVQRCCTQRGAQVKGDINCGGIVGYNYSVSDGVSQQYDARVLYCYNKGNVVCTAYAGGIVGRNASDGANEGTGIEANATVAGCYNQGVITGAVSVAGIVGQNFGGKDAQGKYGVFGCYNSGDVNYNIEGYTAGRIYLSVSACSWAETDLPDITVHYWKKSGDNITYTTSWPGVKMEKTTIGTSTFYYTDLPNGLAAKDLSGVIFCRVNPKNSGEVFNSTADITAISGQDSAIYYIDNGWTTANLVEPCCGAIAGYNKRVNDCYYARAYIGGTHDPLATVASGQADNCGACSPTELRAIYTELNNALTTLKENVFAAGDNAYPELYWQQAN